jgi:hypothetical protein
MHTLSSRWLRMIEAGEVSSLREIAQRDGADHSYVAKHLNLTLLAPDIVAAILEDTLPDGVRLSALLINPPVLWEDQRAALGTTPAPSRVRRGLAGAWGNRLWLKPRAPMFGDMLSDDGSLGHNSDLGST